MRLISVAIALALISPLNSLSPVQATPKPIAIKQVSPPPNGTPDNRGRAGTRSACGETEVAITPMVPQTNGESFDDTSLGEPVVGFDIPDDPQTDREEQEQESLEKILETQGLCSNQ